MGCRGPPQAAVGPCGPQGGRPAPSAAEESLAMCAEAADGLPAVGRRGVLWRFGRPVGILDPGVEFSVDFGHLGLDVAVDFAVDSGAGGGEDGGRF